jgi:hypothetical protein
LPFIFLEVQGCGKLNRYIYIYRLRTCMAMQKRFRHDDILVQLMVDYFYKFVPKEVFQQNHHLLILDGYGSHVVIEALKQAI